MYRAYFCLYYKSLQIHRSSVAFFANADRVPGSSAEVRFAVFQILPRAFLRRQCPPPVAAELLVGFPGFSVTAVIQALIQITLNTLFLYIAVTPIIAFTARIPNGHMIGVILAFVYGYGGMFAAGNMSLANLYPITASMGLIQYRSHDAAVHWNIGLCSLSMIVVLLISVAIVVTTKNVSSAKVVKKPEKTALKKGW